MKFSLFSRVLTGKFAKEFLRCSEFSPTALSLQTFLSFGRKAKASDSFMFLRNELPVRLANIMQEIHLLPDKMHETEYVKLVSNLYEKSFCELLDYVALEPTDTTVTAFTDRIASIRDRHAHVVETMAQGVMEVKERKGIDASTENQLQYFLDRFYLNRISIRMLINQHVSLFGRKLNEAHHYVGMIDPTTNVLAVVHDAYLNAAHLCAHQYGTQPDLRVTLVDRNGPTSLHVTLPSSTAIDEHLDSASLSKGEDSSGPNNGSIYMTYVPAHLYHICFEILKNAMRAVAEFHHTEDSLPAIKVLICGADENVTIKVFDNGGGIPRSMMDHVFKYTFTTAAAQLGSTGGDETVPMAGYGYGLPVSRLYARYFNGDLSLSSVEGFGTDAIIYLRRRPSEADELLPIFNRTSARQYAACGLPAADWSNPDYTTGLYAPPSHATPSSS